MLAGPSIVRTLTFFVASVGRAKCLSGKLPQPCQERTLCVLPTHNRWWETDSTRDGATRVRSNRAVCGKVSPPPWSQPHMIIDNPFTPLGLGPTENERVKIILVNTSAAAEVWARRLAVLAEGVLGLDIEWRPSIKAGQERRAALLQLSCRGACVLFQLKHLRHIPASLQQLLRDRTIVKVGVGVRGDLDKLANDYNLQYDNYHDVSFAAYRLFGGDVRSVSKLVAALFGHELKKVRRVRMSNWENTRLSHAQVEYAALDAVAGREIYMELRRRGVQMDGVALANVLRRKLRSEHEGATKDAKLLANEREDLRVLYAEMVKGQKPKLVAQSLEAKPLEVAQKQEPKVQRSSVVQHVCTVKSVEADWVSLAGARVAAATAFLCCVLSP